MAIFHVAIAYLHLLSALPAKILHVDEFRRGSRQDDGTGCRGRSVVVSLCAAHTSRIAGKGPLENFTGENYTA